MRRSVRAADIAVQPRAQRAGEMMHGRLEMDVACGQGTKSMV
jgi:hypothetical protein